MVINVVLINWSLDHPVGLTAFAARIVTQRDVGTLPEYVWHIHAIKVQVNEKND